MADLNIRLDWSDAGSIPAQPANLVLVQALQGEYILSFGHAPPPVEVALMDGDEGVDFLKQNAVKVQQITRLTLPAHTAAILVQALGGALRARAGEATPGERGQEEAS